jgi:hypothetical protein
VFSVILTRTWSEPHSTNRWTLQVAVSDTVGNVGVASVGLDPAGL